MGGGSEVPTVHRNLQLHSRHCDRNHRTAMENVMCGLWLSRALRLSTGSREENKTIASPASLRPSPSGSDGELEVAAFPSLPAEG